MNMETKKTLKKSNNKLLAAIMRYRAKNNALMRENQRLTEQNKKYKLKTKMLRLKIFNN